jgi:hypothetical protein
MGLVTLTLLCCEGLRVNRRDPDQTRRPAGVVPKGIASRVPF